MTVQQVVFIVISIFTIGGAFGVVVGRNLFHSALFMVVAFAGIAGYYVLLDAGFIAGVQLLLYVGAIAILVLFALMVSRGIMSREVPQKNTQWGVAVLVAALTFVVLGVALWQVNWPVQTAAGALVQPETGIDVLGMELLRTYIIPFEVISLLLMVALIGAIILSRETE